MELFSLVEKNWLKIIDSLSKVKMSVASFLSEGVPSKLENDILTIIFPNSCSLHKETLQRKENQLLIEKTLSEFIKSNLKVKFILSLSELNKDKTEQKKNSDSFIHSAINAFNARLL